MWIKMETGALNLSNMQYVLLDLKEEGSKDYQVITGCEGFRAVVCEGTESECSKYLQKIEELVKSVEVEGLQ